MASRGRPSSVRLAELEANNRANFLKTLAAALGDPDVGRREHALRLLEAAVGRAMFEFADAENLQEVTPLNRLGMVNTWLRLAEPTDDATLATCRAAVDYVRGLCRREVPTPQVGRLAVLPAGTGATGGDKRTGPGRAE